MIGIERKIHGCSIPTTIRNPYCLRYYIVKFEQLKIFFLSYFYHAWSRNHYFIWISNFKIFFCSIDAWIKITVSCVEQHSYLKTMLKTSVSKRPRIKIKWPWLLFVINWGWKRAEYRFFFFFYSDNNYSIPIIPHK